MEIDRKRVLRVFKEYVASYDSNDEKVRLKIGHTIRVSRL